jgi:hypothetical protein
MPICICAAGAPAPGRTGCSCKLLLNPNACSQGIRLAVEDNEQSIAEDLDNPSIVLPKLAAKHQDQLRDESRSRFISMPLKHARASNQVGKNNSSHHLPPVGR